MQQYWILKSEPEEYSIEELKKNHTGRWDGVRNYQARNFIRTMKEGDLAYFYHSSCSLPGIYGRMQLIGQPYPDPTAFDIDSPYCVEDHHKMTGSPWMSIDIKFKEHFSIPLTLKHIKTLPLGLCPLTVKGNRLSVIPITLEQYFLIDHELYLLNQS